MTHVSLRILLGAALVLLLSSGAHAVVLEGVGHANIYNGDLDAARAEARRAAIRDLSLQYEARVSTHDTMENGVITESRMDLASSARARNVQIIDEYQTGNLLRVIVRGSISEGRSQCGAGEAGGPKKRVAVTGFPMLYPEQARIGRIDDAGEILPQQLQQRLMAQGGLQVFGATTSRMFTDLLNAPTVQYGNNRLSNVLELAREMGVQFVVTGVIRDLGVADPSAWGTSVLDSMQRRMGRLDQRRRFAVDLMIYDGFSGAPVYRERFATASDWDAGPGSSVGFGSAVFQKTAYGQSVDGVISDMAMAVTEALACQPFITRIARVDGNSVTLKSGAIDGLRPGDELKLYRSKRYLDSPEDSPELQDSDVSVTLDTVQPHFSRGTMPLLGGIVNIQRDDIAIIW
ncbi:flagellar assembly protein T N-terminal domain-containing protein [Marinobacter sp. F3R08]|uniref:flagellar assembly protein T N-terminal domain-containing protein n=1 Tax=Marinobacter sp. F3R08 TaxID=2841559 RepID=UPI001C08B97A|nr:flagellar assembly protein T N-terminal domain-containing protein [Marinobacter sp. F3R08]MBU2953558.1 flagella assembly protein FlgT [Marinobacter sp. F3R08]